VLTVLVLVLDSSTPAVTAALTEVTDGVSGDVIADGGLTGDIVADGGVRLLASRCTVDARAHGELLSPQIAACLAEAGVAPTELAALVAGLGPGPFTGLRVGLVTAASMAYGRDVPAYGVNSLDALGLAATAATAAGAAGEPAVGAAGEPAAGTPLLVATDARRREIYWAVYAPDGQRITEPAVATPAAVAEALPGLGVAAAAGDGALRYADVLGVPVRPEPRYPAALALAQLAAGRIRSKAPTEPLTPCYLRRPDAVAAVTRKPVLR
jgi:tRNA threonylcarbamoyl adenosine modification protein YeaZ